MTERQRRERVHDQRPPSRLMRSRMREAFFDIYRLRQTLGDVLQLTPRMASDLKRLFALCRRATARDPRPPGLAALIQSPPTTPTGAIAALNLLHARLSVINRNWNDRLTAAGLPLKWPGDDA